MRKENKKILWIAGIIGAGLIALVLVIKKKGMTIINFRSLASQIGEGQTRALAEFKLKNNGPSGTKFVMVLLSFGKGVEEIIRYEERASFSEGSETDLIVYEDIIFISELPSIDWEGNLSYEIRTGSVTIEGGLIIEDTKKFSVQFIPEK